MLKLGHIIYSNTLPVHAGIISGAVKFPFTLVEGIPTALNRLLSEGDDRCVSVVIHRIRRESRHDT